MTAAAYGSAHLSVTRRDHQQDLKSDETSGLTLPVRHTMRPPTSTILPLSLRPTPTPISLSRLPISDMAVPRTRTARSIHFTAQRLRAPVPSSPPPSTSSSSARLGNTNGLGSSSGTGSGGGGAKRPSGHMVWYREIVPGELPFPSLAPRMRACLEHVDVLFVTGRSE